MRLTRVHRYHLLYNFILKMFDYFQQNKHQRNDVKQRVLAQLERMDRKRELENKNDLLRAIPTIIEQSNVPMKFNEIAITLQDNPRLLSNVPSLPSHLDNRESLHQILYRVIIEEIHTIIKDWWTKKYSLISIRTV